MCVFVWCQKILSSNGPKGSIKLPGLGQRQVGDAWGCWAYSYFIWRPREVWFEIQIVAHHCRVNEIDVRSGGY